MSHNIPNLIHKYNKYLGKLHLAINLYTQKLKMYGLLLQSGGTLDDQLKIAINNVIESLNKLKTDVNTGDISDQINTLKEKFNELAKKYVDTTQTSVQKMNEINSRLVNNGTISIKDLEDFLPLSEGVDVYVTDLGISSLINIIFPTKSINDINDLNDEKIKALEGLQQVYDNPHNNESDAMKYISKKETEYKDNPEFLKDI